MKEKKQKNSKERSDFKIERRAAKTAPRSRMSKLNEADSPRLVLFCLPVRCLFSTGESPGHVHFTHHEYYFISFLIASFTILST